MAVSLKYADVLVKQGGGVDYGTIEPITYFSTAAKRNKKANVLLPADYSPQQKYPVLYVNHGIFGDQDSMLDDSFKIQTMAGNLAASGEAEKIIIVFPSMYTSPASEQPEREIITPEVTRGYDAFLEDITECLLPCINERYSTLTGRENTGIAGFSMGGREALYIGICRPDVFGYIAAACPAPGIVPAVDRFMEHPGCMAECDFRVRDTANEPFVLMLAGGTNDGVVGTFPQQYDALLTANGQKHLWMEIPGGGHDASVVIPLMYSYLKTAFRRLVFTSETLFSEVGA